MRSTFYGLTFMLCLLFSACDGDIAPALEGGEGDDAALTSSDAEARQSEEQTAEPTPEVESTATLSGVVTRSAEIQGDGIGDVYVALFETNPVVLGEGPEPVLVARARLEDQDLNADDCVVSYTLEGIPPRAEPYFVITFFDDNDTIDEDAPGPDKGDLMSLSGPTADEVVLDAPESYEHDMVLNAVMPV